jgi:hypothetical protein
MVERERSGGENGWGGKRNMGRAPRVVDEVTATGRGRSDRGGERDRERSRKRQAPTGRSSCRDRLRTGARDGGANPLKTGPGLKASEALLREVGWDGMPVTFRSGFCLQVQWGRSLARTWKPVRRSIKDGREPVSVSVSRYRRGRRPGYRGDNTRSADDV